MNKILYFIVVLLLVTAIDLLHWEALPNASEPVTGTLSAEPYSALKDGLQGSTNYPGLNPASDIQYRDGDTSIAHAPFLDPVKMLLLGSGLIGLVGLGRKKI